jgi:hypothetical protein
VHYYRHVRKMLSANNTAVKFDPKNPAHDRLPDNYFQYASEIETPVLLTTGAKNDVFRDSNIVCHQRLEAVAPGRYELMVYPGYGHQDVFMGKDVARDTFPAMLDFIRRHSAEREAAPIKAPAQPV